MAYPNDQGNYNGAIPVWGLSLVPPGLSILEYEQITDLAAATDLEPPEGATFALVQVNAGVVRYRRDGVSPTASVGMLAYATSPPMPFSIFDGLEFIQTAASASLNIEWYGPTV